MRTLVVLFTVLVFFVFSAADAMGSSGKRPSETNDQGYADDGWDYDRSEDDMDSNAGLSAHQKNKQGWVSEKPYGAFKRAPASKWDQSSHWNRGHQRRRPSAVNHHRVVNDVTAEKALVKLKNGNLRYTQRRWRKPSHGASQKDRIRLLAGQRPHTIILSCSDSRVPPEIVFNQKLGEIFTVRSAGEALDAAVIASIEYAVAYLGTQLLLVLGHESCGAVTAALQTMPNQSAGSPYLDAMVADIQPRIASFLRRPASSGLIRESTANARGVVKDLIKRSTISRTRVAAGTLQIRSALYHMDSGTVEFH